MKGLALSRHDNMVIHTYLRYVKHREFHFDFPWDFITFVTYLEAGKGERS
jgi:hypothetical protein